MFSLDSWQVEDKHLGMKGEWAQGHDDEKDEGDGSGSRIEAQGGGGGGCAAVKKRRRKKSRKSFHHGGKRSSSSSSQAVHTSNGNVNVMKEDEEQHQQQHVEGGGGGHDSAAAMGPPGAIVRAIIPYIKPTITSLPDVVVMRIVEMIGSLPPAGDNGLMRDAADYVKDLSSVRATCRRWKEAVNRSDVWEGICLRRWPWIKTVVGGDMKPSWMELCLRMGHCLVEDRLCCGK